MPPSTGFRPSNLPSTRLVRYSAAPAPRLLFMHFALNRLTPFLFLLLSGLMPARGASGAPVFLTGSGTYPKLYAILQRRTGRQDARRPHRHPGHGPHGLHGNQHQSRPRTHYQNRLPGDDHPCLLFRHHRPSLYALFIHGRSQWRDAFGRADPGDRRKSLRHHRDQRGKRGPPLPRDCLPANDQRVTGHPPYLQRPLEQRHQYGWSQSARRTDPGNQRRFLWDDRIRRRQRLRHRISYHIERVARHAAFVHRQR